MSKTLEPISAVEPTRPEETRTERRTFALPALRREEPTPPASDPHKGRVIDVMV